MKNMISHTIGVVGPDRVGKSTLIQAIENKLRSTGVEYTTLHFSGPQPYHNSPIEQYTSKLENIYKGSTHEVVLCDRFGSEVCFYEKFRRNYEISTEWAQSFESYVMDNSEKVSLVYLYAPWDFVRQRHVDELENTLGGEATAYYKNMLLGARQAEHEAYLDFMADYLNFRCIIPSKSIIKKDTCFIDTEQLITSLFQD